MGVNIQLAIAVTNCKCRIKVKSLWLCVYESSGKNDGKRMTDELLLVIIYKHECLDHVWLLFDEFPLFVS